MTYPQDCGCSSPSSRYSRPGLFTFLKGVGKSLEGFCSPCQPKANIHPRTWLSLESHVLFSPFWTRTSAATRSLTLLSRNLAATFSYAASALYRSLLFRAGAALDFNMWTVHFVPSLDWCFTVPRLDLSNCYQASVSVDLAQNKFWDIMTSLVDRQVFHVAFCARRSFFAPPQWTMDLIP